MTIYEIMNTPVCDEYAYDTWSEGNQGMGDDYAEHVIPLEIALKLETRLQQALKALKEEHKHRANHDWDDPEDRFPASCETCNRLKELETI
jgi:hypothetical protein